MGQPCTLQCANDGACVLGDAQSSVLDTFGVHPDHADPGAFDHLKDEIGDNQHCDCGPFFTGNDCSVEVESCAETNHKCFHGGDCVVSMTEDTAEIMYICDCRNAIEKNISWVGKYCEYPSVEPCDANGSHFCVNGGTCNGEKNPCSCPQGFLGDRCEYHEGTVASRCSLNCLNGGRCQFGFRDITQAEQFYHTTVNPNENFQHCVCPDGYGGRYCEIQHDECGPSGHFCYHGGSCKSLTSPQGDMTQYFCDCTNAADHRSDQYVGQMCHYPATSFCTKSPGVNGHPFCANNGKCLDQGNGIHECECPADWEGDRCEFPKGFVPDGYEICNLSCGAKGKCREGAKDHGLLKAMEDLDHIINQTVAGPQAEHCECVDGYSGVLCDIKTEVCGNGDHICFHGSQCVRENDGWTCDCDARDSAALAAGKHCQHKATSLCAGNKDHGFCVNDGECISENGNHVCQCKNGYTGKHCEVPANSVAQTTSQDVVTSGDDGYKVAFFVLLSSLIAGAMIFGLVYCVRRQGRKEMDTARNVRTAAKLATAATTTATAPKTQTGAAPSAGVAVASDDDSSVPASDAELI